MGVKYNVNEKFFSTWGNEMAYVLGFFFADGSLEDASYIRGKYIRFSNTNIEVLKYIKNVMSSEHTIQKLPIDKKYKNAKQKYLLRIGNTRMYETLLNYGLVPNKSLTMKFPSVPKKYISDFIRGYFDGDGCVFVERNTRTKNIKRIRVIFTSGSRNFLSTLAFQIEAQVKLPIPNIGSSGNALKLIYNSSQSVLLFKFLYKNIDPSTDFYMREKFGKFSEYFFDREEKIDSKVKSILECLGGS